MKKKYFINANIVDPHNSINEIGGLIIKSETCIGTDLILFGKLVFIIKDSNFLIFKNETGGSLAEAIDDFIKQIANTG